MSKAIKYFVTGFAFVLAFVSLGMAQGMGGGMGGRGSTGSTNGGNGSTSMTMGGGMGSDAGMNGAAMGMSNSALTVGSNGTLYILSRVLPQSGQTTGSSVQTKLSALSPDAGTTLWSVVFDENWLTRPVEGPDGRILLVALGDRNMVQGGMFGSTSSQDENSRLYIVVPASKNVITVKLDGDIASLPLIGGTGGNYTVYIVTFDMGSNMGNQGGGRTSTLYGFTGDGAQKFKLSLDQ